MQRPAFISFSLAVLSVVFSTGGQGQTDTRPVVLQDVRLIDGTGAPPRDHMQVIFASGKIVTVRSALTRIALPPNAQVINLTGKVVMPGLINGHGHLGQTNGTSAGAENYTPENIKRQLTQYERYGVTTMISLGLNKDLLYQLRSAQQAGQLGGTTILTADHGIGVPGGYPPVKLGPDQLYRPSTPEEARKAVDEMAARDPNLLKIWVDDNLGKLPKMKPEIYGAVIDEAHKRRYRVASHLFYLEDAKRLLADGVDVIAHSIRDTLVDADTVSAMKSRHVYYIPTLQLEESFYIYADHPSWMDSAFFKNAAGSELTGALTSPSYIEKTKSDKSTAAHQAAFKMAGDNLKKLKDAGVFIGFGTDSGANPYRIQGWAEHRELELMVQAGLSPLEAIHAATATNAEMLHIANHTGTVEKGKSADLLVLDADPTVAITNTEKIAMVFHQGKQIVRNE